jgi:DNA-binding transcriptional ArsR family regulator
MSDDTVSSLRATAHPLRLRMLSLLTGAAMSAAEVARELDVTHANASYHLRVLLDAGQLVEAGEEKIRGGVAKRYRHPWDAPQPHRGPASEEDQAQYVAAMAAELVRRSRRRDPAQRQLLTDAETWISEDAWQRAQELVTEASRIVHAEARPPRTPGTVHVNLTASVFRMRDDA